MTDPVQQTVSLPVLRLICAALMIGEILFAGVVALLRSRESNPFEGVDVPYISVVAGAMAVAVVPLAFVLRGKKFAEAASEPREALRLGAYAGSVILFFAMLEGVALFNIVAWMLTGELVPPVAALALIVAIQGASFPSQGQFENLGR